MEIIFGLVVGTTVVVIYATKVGRHVEEDVVTFEEQPHKREKVHS